MPDGIPVATVAVNGAKNAGILAAQIIGITDKVMTKKLANYKLILKQKVDTSVKLIARKGFKAIRNV